MVTVDWYKVQLQTVTAQKLMNQMHLEALHSDGGFGVGDSDSVHVEEEICI